MTKELQDAIRHIKTRSDAWAVKVIEDALVQEPCENECTEKPCLGKLCRYYKEPYEDAISREVVIKNTKELFSMGDCYCDEKSIVGMINSLPSVRLSRKGHWTLAGHLATSNNGLELFGCVCSECERITFISSSMDTPKCCPFCETKMSEQTREMQFFSP